jgi:hypothetical protein
MEAITRRRLLVALAVTLGGYVLSLVLIGAAAGFDHGGAKWLIAAGLSALAVGMLGSVAVRVVVLFLDPSGRALWWAKASRVGRVWRATFLLVRVAMAVFVWGLAARSLR